MTLLENKSITILTHDLVDIDGLASCFTLKYFLNQYFKNQEISIFFSELSKLAKNFIRNFSKKFPEFNFSYNKNINLSKTDLFLIVDTNNLNQIKIDDNLDILHLGIPYTFIDHHYIGEKSGINEIKKSSLTFENYSSTVEIILDLFEIYNVALTVPIKILILAGIITDSGFFKHGNNKTIQNVSKLLGEHINIQDILFLLKRDIEISEKIAKIKGIQRVELIREGEILIGITNTSSFGASVATMLIKLGFDIAIVLSKELNQYRINTRAKKVVCLKRGLHLGKILEEISEQYEGSGGGHDGAASLITNKETDFIITKIIEKIKKCL
ncbi:MAG: DHH family phosphoesterase [Promethearchaeota archaeon]|nr:MAG: DHH family phosphoesterase [Candidatus Lokiarchaeota archaeon]